MYVRLVWSQTCSPCFFQAFKKLAAQLASTFNAERQHIQTAEEQVARAREDMTRQSTHQAPQSIPF